MSSSRLPSSSSRWWPLDRVAGGLMIVLTVAAVLLIALGDHAVTRVQTFSWDDYTVGAEDIAFSLNFSRPMDPDSVAANLVIKPDLPGRMSWAGRRMAYTLDAPIPYGKTFEVTLADARDRFGTVASGSRFEPFTGLFQSRDRVMAYIGTQAEETGRLVFINFTQGGAPVLLTPPNLTVLDFKPYPLGDRILFSAVATDAATQGDFQPSLYTVATGLTPNPPTLRKGLSITPSSNPAPAGTLTLVLGNDGYQNLAFDLSSDGRLIVVQRVSLADPSDFGVWLVREGEDPRPLEAEAGGEFLIAPDNQTLLMLQGQGTAVIPLDLADTPVSNRREPLDFLPEFGRVFDISSDGMAAAMVDFNQNDPAKRFTESLVLVTNQGEATELLNVTGAIVDAQFDPTNRILYVIASQLLPGETYQEQPFLTAINLQDQEPLPLLTFAPQARTTLSIAPDGLAALLEVAVPTPENPNAFTVQTVLLPLFASTDERLSGTPAQAEPQILPYVGSSPQWFP